jgi:hypothetical protein
MGRGEAAVMPGHWPGRLDELKQRYIAGYAAHHRRLRLGPNADNRREAIYRSETLKTILQLDKLRLLPSGDLRAWQERISALTPCPEFHEGLLANEPICPRCNLNPAVERAGLDAHEALSAMEGQLDDLLTQWQRAVVSALDSDIAKGSLAAMTAEERGAVDAFLAHPEAPTLPRGFVEAANKALQGIASLPLSEEALIAALREGGLPCTVEDFRGRFARFLLEAMRGHDEANTRLTLGD